MRDVDVDLANDSAITSVSHVGGGRVRIVLRGTNGATPTAASAEALLDSHGFDVIRSEPVVEVIATRRTVLLPGRTAEAAGPRGPRSCPDVEVTLAGVTGPQAVLRDDTSTLLTITAVNRVSLLYYLALALAEDRWAGVAESEAGWRSNRQASVAVWGRPGSIDPRRLKSLTFNLRAELRAGGVDPGLVDKRRGAVRFRAHAVRVR